MVRGEQIAAGLTLFPNPSSNGKATLLFEGAGSRDILVSDVSGRTVKQLTAISSASVVIDQLSNGFYNIQVIDRTTNVTTTARLIVRK